MKYLDRAEKYVITILLCNLTFALVLSSCSPQPTPFSAFITTEEYQVYRDLLLKNPDMWNVPPGTQKMIIFEQSFMRPEPQTVYALLQNMQDVSEHLISNFLEANQKAYHFEDQFNLGVPVAFVSDASIKNLVRGLRFAEQCQHTVEAIYPRPEFGGFYYFSRVGFDPSKKTALLYIEKSLCGGNGGLLILKKEAETWIISNHIGAFNSDLGLYLTDPLSEEEHAVQNAVLNASLEFIQRNGYQYLTVFDQTGISDQLLLEGMKLFPMIKMRLPGVTEEMMNNINKNNIENYYLSPQFSFDKPVLLVSWQEYWTLSQTNDESVCLSNLQERFPEPIYQGWLRFSRVGFNQEMNKALVYLDSFMCKSEDFLLYFEENEESWVIVDYIYMPSLATSQ